MTIYIVLRKTYDFTFEYIGVAATEDEAREILQEIIFGLYSEEEEITYFEERNYEDYSLFLIDDMLFEITKEVI